ncbi:MAG: dihydropteridine reductase, partial [Clostridia bacterium]|nr:dihydropteridine reductase [Clostridia bacterium]
MDDKKLIEKIKKDYETDNTPTKFEELKALDKKVKVPVRIFAYIFGIIGTLVLGVGMCLAMKVIGDMMVAGVIIGLLGIVMVVINYPWYHKM